MNKFIGIGRLTADPVVKYTTTGVPIVAFTLAINRPFKNKQGEYDADFLRIVAYNRTAEILHQYTRKGSQIGVEGWVQTRSYDDKDGRRVYVTEIIADRIHLLDPKRDDYQQPMTYTYTQSATHTQQPTVNDSYFDTTTDVDVDESDLPF